jgi:hypothetical protein
MPTILTAATLIGLLHAGPVILTGSDIGDNYYDAPPAAILEPTAWLGLFIDEGRSDGPRKSQLAAASVGFALREEPGPTVYRLTTTPPGAALLVSGVPRLSAGAATTIGQHMDLGGEERQAAWEMGRWRYRIRLDATHPTYCDAVITLTEGERQQTLFDAAVHGTTNDPSLVVSCGEPHFRIHWAGDLDRDGRLDLVVTFSRKYSYHPRQLFLSSAASSGELVSEVARHDRFAE